MATKVAPKKPSTWPKVVLERGDSGLEVRRAQRELQRDGYRLAVDGEFGPETEKRVRAFQANQGLEVDGQIGRYTWARLFEEKVHAKPKPTLREKAYRQAVRLVGVMESGGNNRGRDVEKIIAEGGGRVGDAWCGWFCATVYKRAGSKSITWRWGAVRLYLPGAGLRRTSNPKRGDLVRFTFDHVGMFVRHVPGGIETIEGNTGASGAVSDSRTGGDGVYRKKRSASLVRDYIEVTR